MNIRFGAGRSAAPLISALSLAIACELSAHAQPHSAPDEVIVTGVMRDRAPGELAQSVTVVGGDTLDRLRAANLGETLANQLGVSSSYFGAGASRPIIRGLAGARVQMLEDGIDSMDAATVSDDHAVTVEPLAAEQIEIFRGPTTLLYGSGAVGGVVNTVTTRIPTRAPADGFEGAVEVRGDTVADLSSAALRLYGGSSRFAWHFDGASRESDDYDIPGFASAAPEPGDIPGVLANSAAESDAAAFGASWLGANGFLGLGLNSFDALYGIPGEEEDAVRIDLTQRRVDLRGGLMDLSGAIEGVNVRLGVNDYEHVELEGEDLGTTFTNDATELRVELLHRAIGHWSGAFGVQMGDRDFAAIGEEAFVPPVESATLGVFLVEELDLDAWELSFGGRLESQEHTPSNALPSFDDDAASLSFGAVRSLGDEHSLALTLAQSERLPVVEELYSDGPHLATGAVQIGDPTLHPETAQHLDVAFRAEGDRLTWSVTGFRTRYDDFIYLADTGVVDPVDGLPIFVYTQADAEFSGVEAELFVPIMAGDTGELDVRLFGDYVRGELTSGEPLPRLPPLRFGARFQYHNDRLLLGLEGTRHEEQDEIAAFETVTPGYTLINADFRWRLVTGGGNEIETFVNASNLGDEEARKHTSFVKDIAPLPGRNYSVGIRSRF
jgi:iron complex outermembrane receptor protein